MKAQRAHDISTERADQMHYKLSWNGWKSQDSAGYVDELSFYAKSNTIF